MKTYVTLGIVFVVALALVFPTMAYDATTSVTIATGGGTPPIIKAKWEIDSCSDLESGDVYHNTPGSQFLPPLEYNAYKDIAYFAVVTDEEDGPNLLSVAADVYHPCPGDNADPSVNAQWPVDGSFKYQVMMFKLFDGRCDDRTEATVLGGKQLVLRLVQKACDAGIVAFNEGYDCDDLIFELREGTASLWVGAAPIHYHQPAGYYYVKVYATDHSNNLVTFDNWFYYVPVAQPAFDFQGVNYGSVNMGVKKIVNGDFVFDPPTSDKPTVRSIGNFPTKLTIWQDDMGFGQSTLPDGSKVWNVLYDVGLNYPDVFPRAYYEPFQTTEIPGYLWRCNTMKMDFSIKVIKGWSSHAGDMKICWQNAEYCIASPFENDLPTPRDENGACINPEGVCYENNVD
jgi:hypothetical protein